MHDMLKYKKIPSYCDAEDEMKIKYKAVDLDWVKNVR